jgi:hypothetical protein
MSFYPSRYSSQPDFLKARKRAYATTDSSDLVGFGPTGQVTGASAPVY